MGRVSAVKRATHLSNAPGGAEHCSMAQAGAQTGSQANRSEHCDSALSQRYFSQETLPKVLRMASSGRNTSGL